MRKKILWITETAVMLALLIAVQALTSGMGNQFVTGSCVNLILAVTALVAGPWSAAVVALVSPFMAWLLNIGPKFIQLVPGIAVGNLTLVLILGFVLGGKNRPLWLQTVTGLGAALAKCAVLYLAVVKLLLPTVGAPEKAVALISAQFSWPQLVTALIGTALALCIAPLIQKALKK